MKTWCVVTPEVLLYPATEIDPAEYAAEVVEVNARTRREAIIVGVKQMLSDPKCKYCREQQSDRLSPFAGVKAYEFGAEIERTSE